MEDMGPGRSGHFSGLCFFLVWRPCQGGLGPFPLLALRWWVGIKCKAASYIMPAFPGHLTQVGLQIVTACVCSPNPHV